MVWGVGPLGQPSTAAIIHCPCRRGSPRSSVVHRGSTIRHQATPTRFERAISSVTGRRRRPDSSTGPCVAGLRLPPGRTRCGRDSTPGWCAASAPPHQGHLSPSGSRDSNPGPPGPKPGALPTCATSRDRICSRHRSTPSLQAPRVGFEPTTRGFVGRRSIRAELPGQGWSDALRPGVERATGVEPATSTWKDDVIPFHQTLRVLLVAPRRIERRTPGLHSSAFPFTPKSHCPARTNRFVRVRGCCGSGAAGR